jgi:hypothetical protein
MSEWSDPYDILLVEHDGTMHGTCFRLVHVSEFGRLVEELNRKKLPVREVKQRGWVQADVSALDRAKESWPDMFKTFRGARDD